MTTGIPEKTVKTNPHKADFYVDDNGNTISEKPGTLSSLYAALKQKAGPALNYIKANPGMSTALGLGGAANLAGLLDGNGIGGQLIGAGLGGAASFLAPSLLGIPSLNKSTALALTLAGGGLGSLFDTARAKRDREAQYAQAINRRY